jgi:hypothetical protein
MAAELHRRLRMSGSGAPGIERTFEFGEQGRKPPSMFAPNGSPAATVNLPPPPVQVPPAAVAEAKKEIAKDGPSAAPDPAKDAKPPAPKGEEEQKAATKGEEEGSKFGEQKIVKKTPASRSSHPHAEG